MEKRTIEIKKGINLHVIETNKFKTDLVSIFLTTSLTRQNVTKNALIASILRRGSSTMPTSEEISVEMEEMYGASFDTGIDKLGDNQVLKFYIESVADKYIPGDNLEILENSIEKILDLAFNPFLENGRFKEEYLEQEKINLKRLIEGKTDNKAQYAYERILEEMYKGKTYGLYKYGYIEDLEKITAEDLYNVYLELLKNARIDIYISGTVPGNIKDLVEFNGNIEKLEGRNGSIISNSEEEKIVKEESIVIENRDVTQGKLLLGLDLDIDENQKNHATVYNTILGGSANSKMFQNVREKEHLAYIAGSSYVKQKNNVIIKSGIDIENYEKALKIIKEQITDMEKGGFSELDMENAKKVIVDSYESTKDEQYSQVTFYYAQEIYGKNVTIDECIESIKKVTKEEVVTIANKAKINTIYFLRN